MAVSSTLIRTADVAGADASTAAITGEVGTSSYTIPTKAERRASLEPVPNLATIVRDGFRSVQSFIAEMQAERRSATQRLDAAHRRALLLNQGME